MGAIYRAVDVPLQRPVALRLVPPELSGDAIVRARLNREATALAAIDHPNVPPIYEAGEHERRLYIASRWIDGVDLATLVREQGPLEPARAVRIVNQVASALFAAHRRGIMHRDVRPTSVLITEADHTYLTDFALARRSNDITGLTARQELARNLDCLAPEYLAGGEADARVDIYGLGCVLFQALTAEPPFTGPSAAAKMYAHAAAEPPSPRARRAEVSARLDAVVRRALAKDPAQRQRTAAQFALEAAAGAGLPAPRWVPASATAESPAPAEPTAAPEHPERPAAREPAGRSAPPEHSEWPAEQPAAPERPAPVGHSDGARYHEPVYYTRRGRRRRRRWAVWTLAVLVFIAAPIALLLALPPRSSAAEPPVAHPRPLTLSRHGELPATACRCRPQAGSCDCGR